jgi:hypothetical protein
LEEAQSALASSILPTPPLEDGGEMWSSTFLDKSRNCTLARLLTCEERLQLFDDDAVQNGLFRLAGNIFEGTLQHAEALKAGVQPTQVIVRSATF